MRCYWCNAIATNKLEAKSSTRNDLLDCCEECYSRWVVQAEFEQLFLKIITDGSKLGAIDELSEFWKNHCHQEKEGYLGYSILATEAHLLATNGEREKALSVLARIERQNQSRNWSQINDYLLAASLHKQDSPEAAKTFLEQSIANVEKAFSSTLAELREQLVKLSV